KWDTTPQGNFGLDVSYAQFEATNRLAVDWATKTDAGKQRKNASRIAADLNMGYRTYRSCLGVIHCSNAHCAITIRPHTHSPADLAKQLTHSCKCGNTKLLHKPCPNKSSLIQWAHGVRYGNVKAAPAALISGNTINGTSAPEISSVLVHAGRVGRMRNTVLGQAKLKGGDDFVETFMDFQRQHPGFIVANTMLGGVTVISSQTPFMASQLHDEACQIDGPFNGIISDAAHGWWKVQTSLLIISSVFSQIMLRWVPVLISYSNGASSLHYEQHFLALFEAVAQVVNAHNKSLIDELFAGVVDFSEAERMGFINAFVRFWLKHSNARLENELRKKAETLLRGCLQHFHNSITRVKRIAAIV
ncbi:hypothetical protein C8J55DRAFT_394042, partial [Lentinula edodes]